MGIRGAALSRLVAGAGLCLTLPASPAIAQLPTVGITSWELSANGTGVVFQSFTPTAVSDGQALTDETKDGLFEYSLDTSDIKWADECRCFRYYVVTIRSKQTGTVSRHKFKAKPSGSFEDQRVQVRLTVTAPGSTAVADSEEISLPVASAPGLEPAPLVVVETREPMGAVSLGGASELQIVLRNPSKHFEVQVPSDMLVTSDQNSLWKQPPVVEGQQFPLRLAPNASEVVRLRVEPKAWEAIQASIVPSSSEKPHTALHVRVPYTNTLFQRREGQSELELPIRFRPSLITLAVALAAGVVLGSLIPLFSRKTGSVARWYRATLAALVVATILELVGIFMVANDSKFMVLGFDADPWQTLPVLLLGVTNGLLGLEAAKRLRILKDEPPS